MNTKKFVGLTIVLCFVFFTLHCQNAQNPVETTSRMEGALDKEIPVATIECIIGEEGCTPGYWKNHLQSWPANLPPHATIRWCFIIPLEKEYYILQNDLILKALEYGGGPGMLGAARILLRAASAALLNAYNSVVKYPLTGDEIKVIVNAELATGTRETMLILAKNLDEMNNLYCPLGEAE